jgi:hypothetical protein
MSVISIDTAIEHLRAEDDDRAFVQGLLDAVEEAAAGYLQRALYADHASLDAARSSVTVIREAARLRYGIALTEAGLILDMDDRNAAITDSKSLLREAQEEANAIARGLVMTPQIQAACLLMLGHLYTNREDVVAGSGTMSAVVLPKGSKFLLDPYRTQLGV